MRTFKLPTKAIKLFLLTSIFISCTSIEKQRTSGLLVDASSFSTKLDLTVDGKNQSVDVHIVATKFANIRLDISSAFGINVASIALDDGHLSYFIHSNLEYYSGKYHPKVIIGGVQMPVTLLELTWFLFDIAPEGWVCEKTANTLSSCARNDIKIHWQEINKKSRKINVHAKESQAQIYIKSSEHNIKVDKDIFRIAKP